MPPFICQDRQSDHSTFGMFVCVCVCMCVRARTHFFVFSNHFPHLWCDSPINMPDLNQKCFGFCQLRPMWSLNWAGLYMLDPTSRIQVGSFFSKEGPDHIVRNWSRPDLDGLVRFGANASGLEASWSARITGPSFWQNVTSLLPVSHFQIQLCSSTGVPDCIAQNQPWSDWVLADCVRFGPIIGFWLTMSGLGHTDPVRKQAGAQETSACFCTYPDRIRIGSDMYTGKSLRSLKRILHCPTGAGVSAVQQPNSEPAAGEDARWPYCTEVKAAGSAAAAHGAVGGSAAVGSWRPHCGCGAVQGICSFSTTPSTPTLQGWGCLSPFNHRLLKVTKLSSVFVLAE